MGRNTAKPYLRGKTWWIKFYRNGQPVRESSNSTSEADAKRLLKIRLGQVETGEYRGPAPSRVSVSELLDLVIADYKIARKRSLADLTCRIEKNIRPKLDASRAALFGTANADRYIQARREGFVEDGQYRALLKELPIHLQAIFVAGYHIGVRLGTLRKLEWEQVDLNAGEIRLLKKQVKQKRAHTVPIYGDMRAFLEMQLTDHERTGRTALTCSIGSRSRWEPT